jgi:hypothetical protein
VADNTIPVETSSISKHTTRVASSTKPMTNIPECFVGWGTLTLINAGLAQGKNRSGLNWFLLSLRLGQTTIVGRMPKPTKLVLSEPVPPHRLGPCPIRPILRPHRKHSAVRGLLLRSLRLVALILPSDFCLVGQQTPESSAEVEPSRVRMPSPVPHFDVINFARERPGGKHPRFARQQLTVGICRPPIYHQMLRSCHSASTRPIYASLRAMASPQELPVSCWSSSGRSAVQECSR